MKVFKNIFITVGLIVVILSFKYGFIILLLLLLQQARFPKNSFLFKIVNFIDTQTSRK